MWNSDPAFGGTVTLYNRWYSGTQESWQRTVLHGVAVLERKGEAIRHAGAAASSARRIGPVVVGELTLLVPVDVREGYRTPARWRAAQPPHGWTMQPGDVVILGTCELEVTGGVAALTECGERFATINMVTDYTADSLMGHWEVEAR